MRRAQEQTAHQTFTCIGAGACGAVFQQSGNINIAKRTKTDLYALQLWNDYVIHLKIQDAFAKRTNLAIDIRIPQALYFISKDDKGWWKENEYRFPAGSEDLPKQVLAAERILPLHKDIRTSLIKKYCAEDKQQYAFTDAKNADCLMRVYLGAERLQRKSKFGGFTLRNFFLYITDMDDLNLDASMYATSMAQTLAIMHWEVKSDARDVEFVLGNAPSKEEDIPQISPEQAKKLAPGTGTRQLRLNSKRHTVQLWMIDFDQAKAISMDVDGVAAAVKAYMDNDPYFPKPLSSTSTGQKLWTTFSTSYLQTCETIMRLQEAEKTVEWQGLPEAFIKGVMDSEQHRLEQNAEAECRLAEGH